MKDIKITQSKGFYSSLGYQSVRVANNEGRSATQAAGFAQYQYDRPKSINQSREFMRNNGIYRGMIERAIGYIIGNGFALQPSTGLKKFNRDVEILWKDYWKRPDIRGVLSGRRVERMIGREILTCGDTGILKIDNGLIQLIESEQVAGPKFSDDGIIKDETGKPIKFVISPYGTGGRVNTRNHRQIDPKDFLFITEPDRPSSIRGMPPCQSIFAMLHRINDVCDSEAIAWQMLARVALSITRADGAEQGYGESTADTNATDTELADRLTELDYALIFHGEPGEEIKGIDRNVPGQNFSESLTMFMRLLGLPLGLPLEVILLDWTKSNYSQSRAVLEQAYQSFLGWQMLIEDFSSTPIYIWKVKQWMNEGRLANRKDAFSHSWIKPTFPWLDQLKEAQAYGMKVDRAFSTQGMACKSLGTEREDVVAVRESEIRDSIDRAKKIEAETGVLVPWQLFAGLEVQTAQPKQEPEQKQEDKDDAEQSIDDNSAK